MAAAAVQGRDGLAVERWNRLHPTDKPKKSYLESTLDGITGPFIASSDNVRLVPDQIRNWVPGPYHVLGTDGFGRSDSRKKLRHFFEVDRYWVVLAALVVWSILTASGDATFWGLPMSMGVIVYFIYSKNHSVLGMRERGEKVESLAD